jgi:hypothetical protein
MGNLLRTRSARRRGTTLTEFALWLPILFVLLSGMLDFTWFMNRYSVVQRATRDGARFGASLYENANVEAGALIEPQAEASTREILTLARMPCDEDCLVEATVEFLPFKAVRVEVDYLFMPIVGLVPMPDMIHTEFVLAAEFQ